MLRALSIRDIVLIEKLDLKFNSGLTVLTGETGAGKSILLDSLGLVLGERANTSLIRANCTQAQVTAEFELSADHRVFKTLSHHDISLEPMEPLMLRRVISNDGRSRAYINNQPVSIQLLKTIADLLVDIQNQHGQTSLINPNLHLTLLDLYGDYDQLLKATAETYRAWKNAVKMLQAAETALEESLKEEEWLRQSVEELSALAPQPEEEEELASQRHTYLQNEKQVEAIKEALQELTPTDRRSTAPSTALYNASRTLARLLPSSEQKDEGESTALINEALTALETAQDAIAEAETLLGRAAFDSQIDTKLLEQTEERLFALRAAARKFNISVSELPTLLKNLQHQLDMLDAGNTHILELKKTVTESLHLYEKTADSLTAQRKKAAHALETAILAELAPLKLDKARFVVSFTPLNASSWSACGKEQATFLITTNPGQPPAPLAKVASGGELSRLLLAIKVILADKANIPILIFDEIDAGAGGATAAAIGERLAKIARTVQVMVVTHSPQVASKGHSHFHISKTMSETSTHTHAFILDEQQRIEELARMLSGDLVTDAARAAATSLLNARHDG